MTWATVEMLAYLLGLWALYSLREMLRWALGWLS